MLLAVAVAIVLLSCCLTIAGEREVQVPGLGWAVPGVCTYRRWFGVDCPGCGLTRSFISLGHGNWSAAWHFNPAGPFGFLFVVAQIPYRGLQIYRVRRRLPEWNFETTGQILLGSFLAILFCQWLVRSLLPSL